MEIIKTVKVKLSKEEKNAIAIVLHMFESMLEESEDYEREELWKQYGSNEDGWVCIEDTLKNLFCGG